MYRMLPTRPSNACYCCCRPTPQVMDIDLALQELGMLSTVTESRRQYLQEMKDRNRTHSESALSTVAAAAAAASAAAGASSAPTPSSPRTPTPVPPRLRIQSMSGYQLVQIDTKYVQGVSTASPGPPTPDAVLDPRCRDASEPFSFGTQFSFGTYRTRDSRDSESEARRNRMARIKYARSQRFNKPYSIPGRLYHSLHEFELGGEQGPGGDRSKSKSNSNSPVKPGGGCVSLTRSRSLDNLNLCKVRLSNLLELKESKMAMEQVAQEMEQLNVKD